MKTLLPIGLFLLGGLASCATSSEALVEGYPGYTVLRGRIVQVEDLSAADVQRLGDGLALTTQKPGCKLSIQFEDNSTKVMSLGSGVVLVYGKDQDYVLQAAPGAPAR